MSATNTAPARARRPALDRPTAMRLAATEYQRFTALLQSLAPDDWSRPTECSPWDVRDMAAHILGMAEMAASFWEGRRQQREAAKRPGPFIDALTALQVEERRSLTPSEITAKLGEIGPRAARARRRVPGLVRRRTLPGDVTPDEVEESWTLGFLIDIILTRDPWMHRVDICRATGREMHLTADHDGQLVADVVAEWTARHGRPYSLHLTGPAGGQWAVGPGGQAYEMDAVEFCRLLSGRGTASGLLAVQVPF